MCKNVIHSAHNDGPSREEFVSLDCAFCFASDRYYSGVHLLEYEWELDFLMNL